MRTSDLSRKKSGVSTRIRTIDEATTTRAFLMVIDPFRSGLPASCFEVLSIPTSCTSFKTKR